MYNHRSIFLENHTNKITDKNVLELSAGGGQVSVNIAHLNPKRYIISDNDPRMLKRNPLFEKNEHLILDILNLPNLLDYKLDTIICCGYLYHTAHPLWALEQILKNKPTWFYLETKFTPDATCQIYEEKIGERGSHTSYEGCIPKNLILPKKIIIEAVESLNYKLIDVIQNDIKPDDFYEEDNYLSFWKKTTGLWFQKND